MLHFQFSTKILVFSAGIHKLLVRIANREALIRLLLQKQSDLGLHGLSMPFWQATTFPRNLEHFRIASYSAFYTHHLMFVSYKRGDKACEYLGYNGSYNLL